MWPLMVSSCIICLLPVQSVHATCTGNATSSKAPFFSQILMVQRHVGTSSGKMVRSRAVVQHHAGGALKQAPNILFLMTDSLDGRLVDTESEEFRNTNLTFLHGVLNENGANFVRSYTNNPVCVPARSSMMTGKSSDVLQVYDNFEGIAASPDGALDDRCVTYFGKKFCERTARQQAINKMIPSALHDLGYDVVMAGKWHVGAALSNADNHWGRNFNGTFMHGYAFDNVHCRICQSSNSIFTELRHDISGNRHGYSLSGINFFGELDAGSVKHCIDFISKLKPRSRGSQRPFFMHCSLTLPHFGKNNGFVTNSTWLEMGVNLGRTKLPKWPNGGIGEYHPFDQYMIRAKGCAHDPKQADVIGLKRAYYGMVVEVDALFSRVWDALLAKGYNLSNTYVMHVSDHGEMAWDHHQLFKSSLYEGSVRVPIQIAGPGVPRKRITHLTSLLDVFPTLLDMARERDWDQHVDLMGSSLLSAAGAPSRAPSVKKLAETHDNRGYVISQYYAYGAMVGSYMFRSGPWKLITFGRTFHNSSELPPLLFNVENDPGELTNLADSKEEVASILDAALREILDVDAAEARRQIRLISYLLKGCKSNCHQKETLWSAVHKQLGDPLRQSEQLAVWFEKLWKLWKHNGSSYILPD